MAPWPIAIPSSMTRGSSIFLSINALNPEVELRLSITGIRDTEKSLNQDGIGFVASDLAQ